MHDSSHRLIAVVCALSYPLLAHASIALNSAQLAAGAIALLCAAALWPALGRGSAGAWFAACALGFMCLLIASTRSAHLPLYAPPVIIPASLSWMFGRTLLNGRTPLIAQLVHAMRRPQDAQPAPEVWVYAKRLTQLWTLVLAVLATTNLTLAAIASPEGLLLSAGVEPPVVVSQQTWSWCANVLGYVLVAALFVIEYAWRRRRFPDQPYRNIVDFLQRAAIAMPALIARR